MQEPDSQARASVFFSVDGDTFPGGAPGPIHVCSWNRTGTVQNVCCYFQVSWKPGVGVSGRWGCERGGTWRGDQLAANIYVPLPTESIQVLGQKESLCPSVHPTGL